MLFSLDGVEAKTIPLSRKRKFESWRANLADDQYHQVVEEIRKRIGDGEVVTSSYLPGSDWSNTPFQPLYVACRGNQTDAAYFFGLLLFEFMIKDDREWYFYKPGEEIMGTRYFQVRK